MNEAKQKAMQDVVEAARLLLLDESTPEWARVTPSSMTRLERIGMLQSAIMRLDHLTDDTDSTPDSGKRFADVEAKLLAAEKLARAAECLLRVPVTVSAIREEYALRQSLHDFYTADSPVCINNPFAAACKEENERAKVGDVVMHKHDSPGLHMCAVEGVNLTVEEVTERYVSVRGDGVRSKWIRIDHGHYTIVKRAEPKRTPQVGEFWRHADGDIMCVRGEDDWNGRLRPASQDMCERYRSHLWCLVRDDHEEWWHERDMQFVAPARKEGEFKSGDRVSFCDREWIVTPDPVQKVNGAGMYLRIHLPPDAAESKGGQFCPQAYAPIGMVTLKAPVEMRG